MQQYDYSFSVEEDNPFMVFPHLQEIACKHYPGEVLDLSRGDPGIGGSPSVKAREFYGFLVGADTVLNNNQFRIHRDKDGNIEEFIRDYAHMTYQPGLAEKHLETLDYVVAEIKKYAEKQNYFPGCKDKNDISRNEVFQELFKYSTAVGGTYHTQWGEAIVKIVIAQMYREFLDEDSIDADDLILTLGVNDAIGTLFKMLGEEGLGYLKPGDTVAASVPAYAPYFNEIKARGLNVVGINTDPDTGKTDLSLIEDYDDRIKVFFIITPNNPTGIKYSDYEIRRIAEIAEKNDALIISDEIYSQMHDGFSTVWKYAKKRTLRLCGRSKIERSPGLRFGDVLIVKETNDYLSNELFNEYLVAEDFKTQFVWSKGPGGNHASFQHTATVPGPSQILGMLHILLGGEERAVYIDFIKKNMEVFYETLGIEYKGNLYYALFNLNAVEGSKKVDVPIEQKVLELAGEYGVVLIPAMKFFSDEMLAQKDLKNYVRASLPNLSYEQVKEAAERIKQYLTE